MILSPKKLLLLIFCTQEQKKKKKLLTKTLTKKIKIKGKLQFNGISLSVCSNNFFVEKHKTKILKQLYCFCFHFIHVRSEERIKSASAQVDFAVAMKPHFTLS